MKSILTTLILVLTCAASSQAQAESTVVYGVGAAKVIRSTSDYYDGQYNVTFVLVEIDEPKIEHTILFRLNASAPTPPIVARLNDLAAELTGHELDLSLRCKKAVSSPSRPFYDMTKMGCEVLSVGHRRPL